MSFYSNKFLSVLTAAVSSGSLGLRFQSYNASPNTSLSVTITGISAGDSERSIAYTISNQASAAFGNAGLLFQGVIGTISDPVSGYYQTVFTEHIVDFFSPAQFEVTKTSDTTGATYYFSNSPVLATVAEASSFGPINNKGYQLCGGVDLTPTQMADLIAEASSDLTAIMRNSVVQAYYIYEFTTTQTNALQYPKRPVQFYWYPYVIRPVLYPFTNITNTFNFPANYFVDRDSGYITFRFAQDILFNYESFDWNNQFRSAYLAGLTYIPQELKTAVLRWIWVSQNSFVTISKISDGASEVSFSIDKNMEKRTIVVTLKDFMQ